MVKVIYYSHWGTYAAYLMAALHVGQCPADRMPSHAFINKHFELCRHYGMQYGNLIFVGVDTSYREVYCIGCKRHHQMVMRAQQHMNDIFNINETIFYAGARDIEGFIPPVIASLFKSANGTTFQYWLFKRWFSWKYPACKRKVKSYLQTLEGGVDQ